MTSLLAIVLAVTTFHLSTAAMADGDYKPKYGGVMAVVKDVQYELVAKPDAITVFIEDHGKKVSTKGATGKLILLTGSNKSEVPLVPMGENGLEARGTFKPLTGTKAVATITLAGKLPISARFEIK